MQEVVTSISIAVAVIIGISIEINNPESDIKRVIRKIIH